VHKAVLMGISAVRRLVIAMTAGAVLAACQQDVAPRAAAPASAATVAPSTVDTPTVYRPVAGIQDLMAYEIDPSADALWDSVSIVTSKAGTQDHHPTTDKQWNALRGRAVVLIEAANLLIMDGRRVAREGVQKLDDQGTPGNYSAEQAQQAIDANRAAFVGFAKALGVVGERMLKAIDAKNPHDLMDAGAALDEVCEGCHLKFWYPGQHIPLFPDQAPET
jgi:hypothetical protein